MPRENSFSDSDGRSLTPDLEEEFPISPVYTNGPSPPVVEPLSGISQQRPLSSPSKKSIHSYKPPIRPKERFRATVRKVMAMHRSTSMIQRAGGRAGAEPGVDPRRASAELQYGNIHQDCVVEVFDYSSVRQSYGKMTNKEFINIMDDNQASKPEPWVKVRWINIGGLSWDVIKAVSIRYNLHPLALEDIFHARRQTRSKADYYAQHLFLRMLCHELSDTDDTGERYSAAMGSTLTDAPRSDSPLPYDDDKEFSGNSSGAFGEEEKTLSGSRFSTSKRKRPLLPRSTSDVPMKMMSDPALVNRRMRLEEEAKLAVLKGGDRVHVKVTPMFIFLLRDGTVISIHNDPTGKTDFTQAISHRLQQRDTVLRKSADPSLVVHSLIDLIVDKALEVIDEYHLRIEKFERQILIHPKMSTVRDLHILSGDLILHKRTLEPIRSVIYGLRRYDIDRAAALVDPSSLKEGEKIVGYMSHKSKIYLADVYDHMEYILTSLDMFSGIGENLINYAFNMTSYQMNDVMRLLTLATIIFLPLTLLTGYFGMNFEHMWSITGSDVFFWEVAIPVMVVIIPTFLASDIRRMWHYIRKKMLASKAVKPYKRD